MAGRPLHPRTLHVVTPRVVTPRAFPGGRAVKSDVRFEPRRAMPTFEPSDLPGASQKEGRFCRKPGKQEVERLEMTPTSGGIERLGCTWTLHFYVGIWSKRIRAILDCFVLFFDRGFQRWP